MPTLAELYAQGCFLDPLRFPTAVRPHSTPGFHYPHLRVRLVRAETKLHSLLPPTAVWTYDGSYPGPTIETESHHPVIVEWVNELTGTVPVISVHAVKSDPPAQNDPGLSGATPDPAVTNLRGWAVTHLHGGRSEPDSDGWTENVFGSRDAVGQIFPGSGQARVAHYKNAQRASQLWYHDHLFGGTRLTVFAGLAGFWFVRDPEDHAVAAALKHTRPAGFHDRTPEEIPLLLQDRNLNARADGTLLGDLVHKVENVAPPDNPTNTDGSPNVGPMEFFGPLTLVNGGVWPHVDVRPLPYRLRVLNGSNARTFRLSLVAADGRPMDHLLRQIGTDGGLLGGPVEIPATGLVLSPAERADLVLDLSGVAPGTKLRWINTAQTPFGNQLPTEPPGDVPILFPEVMEFRVGAAVPGTKPLALPNPLSPSFIRTHHTSLPHHHGHRLIALVEGELEAGGPSMLTLQELVKEKEQPKPGTAAKKHSQIRLEYDIESNAFTETYYRVAARLFHDTLNWKVEFGATEVWKFVNLTGDTHPVHLHLVQFQILDLAEGGRVAFDATAYQNDPTALVTHTTPNPDNLFVDENEKGWKDTIRVNPNEMVAIAATFDGFCGRYMYHCHVLEHEDMEMMRPFVILPADVLALMGMGGHM